jgi:hypothetical protein
LFEGFIGDGFEFDDFAASPTAVSGDDDLCGGIVGTLLQRIGTEPAEDHVVDGTNSRTSEHRHRQLGDHGKVDTDAVAFFHAQSFEGVGDLAYLILHLSVGDGSRIARFPFKNDRGLVCSVAKGVAIDAVMTCVQLSVDKPLNVGTVVIQNF